MLMSPPGAGAQTMIGSPARGSGVGAPPVMQPFRPQRRAPVRPGSMGTAPSNPAGQPPVGAPGTLTQNPAGPPPQSRGLVVPGAVRCPPGSACAPQDCDPNSGIPCDQGE